MSPQIGPTARALVPERVEAPPAGISALDRPCARASIEPRTRVAAAEPLSPHHYNSRSRSLTRPTTSCGARRISFATPLQRRRCGYPRSRADAAGGRSRAPPLRGDTGTAGRFRGDRPHPTYSRGGQAGGVARDQGRCAFVGASGRCRETGFLEFHHVEPFADGGPARSAIFSCGVERTTSTRHRCFSVTGATMFGQAAGPGWSALSVVQRRISVWSAMTCDETDFARHDSSKRFDHEFFLACPYLGPQIVEGI